MMSRRARSNDRTPRPLLLRGVSMATLAFGLGSAPATAQTLGAMLGAQARAPRLQSAQVSATPQRSPTMQAALARQRTTESRVAQIRAYAAAARAAVVRTGVTDGLGAGGLDPTDAIRDAIAAVRAGDDARAKTLLVSAGVINDSTGLTTWEGAGLPSQTIVNGRAVVTIDQTQERALLSWNRFDIGANTTLQFNQKRNGAAQPGWTAVNRVSNAVDPSLVLGTLKADGTVVVLNRAGIVFGKDSQVNTHSLLASTLELGNAAQYVSGTFGTLRATTLVERNTAYLESGLFGPGNGTVLKTAVNASGTGMLVSAPLASGVFSDPGAVQFTAQTEGKVVVDRGAQLATGGGGFLILAAPRIESGGTLSAVDGQVSLQAGRGVIFSPSTGADSGADPFVRGYLLNSFAYNFPSNPDVTFKTGIADGSILVDGVIRSQRGYVSLGTGAFGDVTLNGYLEATTSVSRNGKVAILSGKVAMGGDADSMHAAGIAITADTNGETIPVGTVADPAVFKRSQVVIGTQVQSYDVAFGGLVPTTFAMGRNAVIAAPNASVQIGTTTVPATSALGYFDVFPGTIDLAAGAMIDVAGLKDVELPASRNLLAITPVKRNELRDTPNYREVALDGNFSLNGATLYVDPRLSGVRADGVAWVGSPLIEAGSIAGQVGSTAAEFMTKGGSVTLQTATLVDFAKLNPATAPTVHIARDAAIDFSGGWSRYAAGSEKTSRLLTDDGRIVDIGRADPNDTYVGVVDGLTKVQPRFGIVRSYLTAISQSQRFEPAYDEGADAGSLAIAGVSATIDGTLIGNGFAGGRQVTDNTLGGLVGADGRLLQATRYQLPAGGGLSIETLGDTILYHGTRGTAETDRAELLLNDRMLSDAGLSAFSLTAAGSVTFAGATVDTLQGADVFALTGPSMLTLAPGGSLSVTAGRRIRFDGTVIAPSGRITAKTALIGAVAARLDAQFSNGSAFRTGLYGAGQGDDISVNYLYATNPGDVNPFDLSVTGLLSTAGLWVNDSTPGAMLQGRAYGNGGSIDLTVAPRVFGAIGQTLLTATDAVDLSGSLRVSGTLDVRSGGYVNASGVLDLTAKGGSVALTNATRYASTELTQSGRVIAGGAEPSSNIPVNGTNQSVDFIPVAAIGSFFAVIPSLVPVASSTVDIASATIRGFGFGGGGTLALVAPDISFGSDVRAGTTHVGLDVFRTTGFGTLSLSSYKSRIVDDVFSNTRIGRSAFLETTQFTIGAGEVLDLTQWVLPSILDSAQTRLLRGLASGADVQAQDGMAPVRPEQAWYRRAANLVVGGLTELDVLAGGKITGAPEANLTVSKLYNAGQILLNGGSIQQSNPLPDDLVVGGLAVRDVALGGEGLASAFGGPVDALGRFSETALNAAGIVDPLNAKLLVSNRDLVSRDGADRLVYFQGRVNAADGVVLAAGSVTDLSGVALYDPRSPVLPTGMQVRTGRVVAGGSLRLAAGNEFVRLVTLSGTSTRARNESRLIRDDAATIDISGASGVYDQPIGLGNFAPYREWSSAGTIAALGGGTLGTTAIAARGGAAAAEGGTLEWLRPTLGASGVAVQGTPVAQTDYLSAAMIANSGFDSFIARGSLTLDGDFTLGLRKAFMVTSRDPFTGQGFSSTGSVTIGAMKGTHATISAGYVRLASLNGTTSFDRSTTGDAVVALIGGAQGIDLVGGIGFDGTIAATTLRTAADTRFIGANDSVGVPISNGALVSAGDLTIDARRSYATTGTGNLQEILEGKPRTTALPFTIAALGDHSVTFGNSYTVADAATPLSAGSYLKVLARRIVQNGFVAAPLGVLELGSTATEFIGSFQLAPTETIRFGAGSITSVSGTGLKIPYGTTTDLLEYYYPTTALPITRLPTGELRLAATGIVQDAGARFDGRGGGDVFAYEFQPGIGGSRDLLDRFSRDPLSSNGFNVATGIGYQFADQRQVYALVPVGQLGTIAPLDPIYSADYGASGPTDLYGSNAGKSVILESAPGIVGGEYLLVPAKYAASVPGALRLVENSDASVPIAGASQTLLDGSVVVAGRFAVAGGGIAESQRRSFTVQTSATFLKYSSIKTTSGTTTIAAQATKPGVVRPRLPLDAARVILSPLQELKIAGVFDTTPASGGQGGQFDILGSAIAIATEGSARTPGVLTLTDAALSRLNATSLLIGGRRSEGTDGNTVLTPTAQDITVRSGATLTAPELLLAVGGATSTLTVADGATLRATGTLGTQPTGDYTIATGGSALRLANGAERQFDRAGSATSAITIGAATLSGQSLALDSSGSFTIADTAALSASRIAISGQALQFDSSAGLAGKPGVIGATLEAKLAAADQLTVRSPGAVRFSDGAHRFNGLVLDTAAIAAGPTIAAGGSVSIESSTLRLTNTTGAASGCTVAGFCGAAAALTLAADTIGFGANDVLAAGFARSVTLAARNGLYVEDKGSFSAGAADLTLRTPFVVERAAVADPRVQKIRPDYTFLTSGSFGLTTDGVNLAAKPAGDAAPGARIGIGTIDARVKAARFDGGLVRATAGIIDIQSDTDVVLAGAALETPGFLATFGDTQDPVTVSAGGGTINLMAAHGDIRTDTASRLVIDSGIGAAGTLNLLAGEGVVTLGAAISPEAKGARTGSLSLDSGKGAFDLGGFVTRYGRQFGGTVAVRSGLGSLDLATGQTFKARGLSLTADGGTISIAGTIDTSGASVAGLSADAARNALVNGGDIALWGRNGVTLASTAVLDTHTSGYADTDSRPATAGDVSIGIEDAAGVINIAQGAVIDVGARRTQAATALGQSGARLIPEKITDPATGVLVTVYRYADPDVGGTVQFRAPVIGTGHDTVAVGLHGTIRGADSVQLEAFQRYDLDALVKAGGYSGITRDGAGTIHLDFAAAGANPLTQSFRLADGTDSLVKFIQGFHVSTLDGSSLAGLRLRPGVELAASGAIKTDSQWNLAAASFSPDQLQAAVAAGVLQAIPRLSTGGQTQYQVVPGQEGALLDGYTTFLYRTGGTARGEAPVVTVRAGAGLTVDRTISDGFFTFHDKSDAGYLSNQLGGGNQSYSPAIQFSCGGAGGACANIGTYAAGIVTNPGPSGTVTISLAAAALQGDRTSDAVVPVNSPLALLGNGAAGSVNSLGVPTGDPLGFGELFPLLPDLTTMRSSDIRLVAGAGSVLSANPLHVDRALDANVTVSGEFSYRVTATASVTSAGSLQFNLVLPAGTSIKPVVFDIGKTTDLTETTSGLNRIRDDAYTQINWGTTAGLGADARTAAQQFFAGKGYRFVGSVAAPTGIIVPLFDAIAFLQAFTPTYEQGLNSARAGYTVARSGSVLSYGSATQQNAATTPNQAYVRTVVRSGDGAIAVAAAKDIDLRGTVSPEYRRKDGSLATAADYRDSTLAAPFSASALYTAGVRVAPVAVKAQTIDTGATVSIVPDSPYFTPVAESKAFVPSPKALSDTSPVLAHDGGDLSLDAGRDVLGRFNSWDNLALSTGGTYSGAGITAGFSTNAGATIGGATQRWRTGLIGTDTEIGLAPRYFTSGVGALAGGDVSIRAGRDVSDLTIALDSGVTTTTTRTTAAATPSKVLLTFGAGDLSVLSGRDILGGRYDIATGAAAIHADGTIAAAGVEAVSTSTPAYLRVRLSDAVVNVSARGSATLASVSALGVLTDAVPANAASSGFFSPTASFSLQTNGTATITETNSGFEAAYGKEGALNDPGGVGFQPYALLHVLPPSLAMTALSGSIVLPDGMRQMLYPSSIGQLRLLSDGDIAGLTLTMSDVDPGRLGGAFTVSPDVTPYRLPIVSSNTSDADLRFQHNQNATHAGDAAPILISTHGDFDSAALFLPKQARISADGDIVDLYFQGQNLLDTDITRIRAGGEIRGSIGALAGPKPLPGVVSNTFTLGGPGTLIVEAGGDIGPFVSSAVVNGTTDADLKLNYTFGGGIRTVGNDYNPWLGAQGADLSVRFGVAGGADYAALRDTYLAPGALARLDGDLFEQVTDAFGNSRPDRSKPVYAPILARWLRSKAPAQFAAIFGQAFPDTTEGNAALAVAAYGRMADLYTAFAAIDPLHQQDFLINDLYFNELAQVANKQGPSYQQYVRGYRAVQTLFPAKLGYTDNLAPYTLDPATITPDHPLGEPVRNIVDGQPQVATRVATGSMDLRLATIQTGRGGNLNILAPGGDLIAGSVIRTADQPLRRGTAFSISSPVALYGLVTGDLKPSVSTMRSVPIGYEGILTLQGGRISTFTDGDVRLNQSRVFTQAGGDITMWSSNGDLAAGQGPKSASTFPPVTILLDQNGYGSVNSAGSVSGAGIGSFKRTPSDPASDVILIAPVGEVDAGDAGVRASGNVVVAAARVANADNFKAAGDITGVPTAAVTQVVVAPTDPTSGIRDAIKAAATVNPAARDPRSIITVQVLGPADGGARCVRRGDSNDPDCGAGDGATPAARP